MEYLASNKSISYKYDSNGAQPDMEMATIEASGCIPLIPPSLPCHVQPLEHNRHNIERKMCQICTVSWVAL